MTTRGTSLPSAPTGSMLHPGCSPFCENTSTSDRGPDRGRTRRLGSRETRLLLLGGGFGRVGLGRSVGVRNLGHPGIGLLDLRLGVGLAGGLRRRCHRDVHGSESALLAPHHGRLSDMVAIRAIAFMQATRVTDLIRLDHIWFRSQFAALKAARGDGGTIASLWSTLSARLEVHAAAEEALFYPRLL